MESEGGYVCIEYLVRGILELVLRIERGRSWQVNIPKPSLTACNSTFLFLLSKYAPGGHKVNAL